MSSEKLSVKIFSFNEAATLEQKARISVKIKIGLEKNHTPVT